MMKHLYSILLLLFIFSPLGAKSRRVSVHTPGSLPTLIGERQKYKLTSLAVEGALNGTDLRFLREIAGSDYRQQPTEGRLRTLDLSRATFVRGGTPYIYKDTCRTIQGGPLTLPPFAFRHCRLEQVVLPEQMDTLGVGAFEYAALRSIRLPENAVVMDWAFNHCEQLAQVEFPRQLVELGQCCFRDCAALRSVRIHDIEMLPYQAFQGLPALEEIVIDGALWHVDGWFCDDCPQLRRIEFSGVVFTTGGQPIASNCPLLSDITFSGICMPMNFGSVENCPQMPRQCTVSGVVLASANDEFIPPTQAGPSAERVRELVQGVEPYFGTSQFKSAWLPRDPKSIANHAYNLACVCALKGLETEALLLLRKSLDCGYANYRHVAADTDLSSLHGKAAFEDILKQMQVKWEQEHDFLNVLRQVPAYAAQPASTAPAFSYAAPTTPDLKRVREFFRLDSIAGDGDEISRMKNIMYWLHDHIPHDGSGGFPDNTPRNAIALYQACQSQQRGLNCRGLALVLSEMYLAMGWPARALTCQPKNYRFDPDCHVIDMVWSRQLNKWVWMDPSFAAYVTDENGLLLHPGEVRQRLIDGRPLVLNEDANWNHQSRQTKAHYLEEYMAKNLYYLSAFLHNKFGLEAPDTNYEDYYTLTPEGCEPPNQPALSDEQWFWQAPEE